MTRSSSTTGSSKERRVNVFLLFVILAAGVSGYYLFLFSCWRYPRVPCRWCGGKAPRDPLIRHVFGQCSHCGGHACREGETVPDGPCADHGTDLERARQLRVAAGR
jgi:hypothetical protein